MRHFVLALTASVVICSLPRVSAEAGTGLGGVKMKPKGNVDAMTAPIVGGVRTGIPGDVAQPTKPPYKSMPKNGSDFVARPVIQSFTARRDGACIRISARIANLSKQPNDRVEWGLWRQIGGTWTMIGGQAERLAGYGEVRIDREIPATNETVSLKFEIRSSQPSANESKLFVIPPKRTSFQVQYQTTEWLMAEKKIGRSEAKELRDLGFEVTLDVRTQREIVYGRALNGLSRTFGTREEANAFRDNLRSLFRDPVALQVRVSQI